MTRTTKTCVHQDHGHFVWEGALLISNARAVFLIVQLDKIGTAQCHAANALDAG